MSIAIITGASSGMGKEFVVQLEKYFKVTEIIAIARRKELLDNLKEYTSIKITSLPLDLSNEESFEVYKKFLEDKNKVLALASLIHSAWRNYNNKEINKLNLRFRNIYIISVT